MDHKPIVIPDKLKWLSGLALCDVKGHLMGDYGAAAIEPIKDHFADRFK